MYLNILNALNVPSARFFMFGEGPVIRSLKYTELTGVGSYSSKSQQIVINKMFFILQITEIFSVLGKLKIEKVEKM